ncbi:hypothetical protein A2U01_0108210, partial [Trifolium medium]|nr:hypothetical protein [Trifolium medium]
IIIPPEYAQMEDEEEDEQGDDEKGQKVEGHGESDS